VKERFIEKELSQDRLDLIETINSILWRYEEQGYDLSLRQLYYQLVAANIVPNTEQSYKRVGDIVSDGRLVGLIDWDMIKDRGRSTCWLSHWDSPSSILHA
jgi:predicted RNA-binding protein with PUA domain